MTVVRAPPPPAAAGPSTPKPKVKPASLEDIWETPQSWDATEPRLAEQTCADDMCIGASPAHM